LNLHPRVRFWNLSGEFFGATSSQSPFHPSIASSGRGFRGPLRHFFTLPHGSCLASEIRRVCPSRISAPGTPEPAIITMNGYIRIARGYHWCDNPAFAVADQADFMMIDL